MYGINILIVMDPFSNSITKSYTPRKIELETVNIKNGCGIYEIINRESNR